MATPSHSHSTPRSLFYTAENQRQPERERAREMQDGKRKVEEGRGENVSSNRSCHLIPLKGQQLEIKTKFEINEAHSGGGIRF